MTRLGMRAVGCNVNMRKYSSKGMTGLFDEARVPHTARRKVLVFVVAYNAERTIQQVVGRIPASLSQYDTEVLIIDDSSNDQTFAKAHDLRLNGNARFPTTLLFNPVNQGYGGNQKIGFQYAIQNGFDFVALMHGDGRYAPECLPELLMPLIRGEADAVLGSRMIKPGTALRGGMPLYKYLGNKILTWIQNRILKSSLSEFHSGYRLYSVAALCTLPFDRNTNDFHFDTEILIQHLRSGLRITELPIPTYYGDEIRNVKGLKYAFQALKSSLVSRAQDFGILYDRKFDVSGRLESNEIYRSKFHFESAHRLALQRVRPGSAVADVGCAGGYVAQALKAKHCQVTGIDQFPPEQAAIFAKFIQCDLDRGDFPVDAGKFDYILLLDIVEHLRSPERLLDQLRHSRVSGASLKILFSTGNVAFLITRLGLFLGWFNYGMQGILDLTHTRLFTFRTARDLFLQAGYEIEEVIGVPAPFPLALGDNVVSRLLLTVNRVLIKISKRLFSYQIFMVCVPTPSLEYLLERAREASKLKIQNDLETRVTRSA
jgi:glycosyltransferase involved in cell wall biosynthesis